MVVKRRAEKKCVQERFFCCSRGTSTSRMKSEVDAVTVAFRVQQDIIKIPPTDGLFSDSRIDEDQIDASYD